MFAKLPPRVMIALKSVLYLLVFLIAWLPLNAWNWMQDTGNYNLFAWWPIFMLLGVLPILDFVLGQDPANPTDEQVEKMSDQTWYAVLTLLVVPAQFANLAFGAWVFVNAPFSLLGQIGWILSVGFVSAVLAINVGHELIHRRSKLESWAGGLLYASVW